MGSRGLAAAAAAAVLLFALFGEAGAFYLPGVAPHKYKSGERMRVKVNTLTSDLTPLQVSRPSFVLFGAPDHPDQLHYAVLMSICANPAGGF